MNGINVFTGLLPVEHSAINFWKQIMDLQDQRQPPIKTHFGD